MANENDADVSILRGRANGTFKSPHDLPVGAQPNAVVTGKFNRDGRRDLAVTNQDDNDVSVLINR